MVDLNNLDPAQMAAQLRVKQGMGYDYKAPQGGMAGRVYVGANPMQHIAEVLRGVQAGQDVYEGTNQLKDIQKQRQEALVSGLRTFNDQYTGTPEKRTEVPQQVMVAGDGANDGEVSNGHVTQVTPAMAANPMAAFSGLASSSHPILQQAGVKGILEMPQLLAAQQKERKTALANNLLVEDPKTGQLVPNIPLIEAKKQLKEGTQIFMPSYQPVQTNQGTMVFNARTGQMQPAIGANGQPLVGAQYDPTVQGNVASAKASGTATGKAGANAAINLPDVISQGNQTIGLIDELVKHPGLSGAVGAGRMTGAYKIPGTDAANAVARMEQIKGTQFLQAYQSLKGAGQITEIEGTKAENAIARMQASQSQEEFTKAAKEFQGVIKAGMDRAKGAAGQKPTSGGNIVDFGSLK